MADQSSEISVFIWHRQTKAVGCIINIKTRRLIRLRITYIATFLSVQNLNSMSKTPCEIRKSKQFLKCRLAKICIARLLVCVCFYSRFCLT